jgi:lysozyme family protein
MASGRSLVSRARRHVGEDYRFVDVPKDDPDWRGPWDCAEFVSWLVYQETGVLYGCDDNHGDPHTANAWTGYWKRDVERGGIRVPVEKAAATVGGILLRFPPNVQGKYGHIVVADGRGGTIEAMGKAFGVTAGKVAGRTWHAGILLPEISYDDSGEVAVSAPLHRFAVDAPDMNPAIVRAIQEALKAKGFDPGPIDGVFGEKTMKAVVAFQDAQGLVVDGEVADVTADQLAVDLVAPAPEIAGAETGVSHATDLGTEAAMGPLIPIALQLLPGLINLIAGDKSGAFQASITKAVSDIAGSTDQAAVRQKIESDPAVAAQLQLKLAQIAADQEDKRSQAQLAALKAQQDAQFNVLKARQDEEAGRRRDELDRFKASLQDTDAARSRAYDAMKSGGPAAWAPIAISLIVTVGFFGTFYYLINAKIDTQNGNFQFVNLTLGALVAAFTTVVSFWLGSSQGSRIKDVASADIQAAQAQERNDTIRSQAETIQKTQATSLEAARQASIAENKAQPAAPKRSNFQKCVDIILSKEGGFVNRSDDSGGPTNLGVTLETLNNWRTERGEPAATIDDVRNLTLETATEIYRTKYWNVLRCDDLPPGVDLATFDFGVNAGPGRAAKFLQAAVGAASDGSVGPATIAAAKAARPQDVIARLSQQRLDFYRQAPGFAAFGAGWTNRTNQVGSQAIAMADAEGEAVA